MKVLVAIAVVICGLRRQDGTVVRDE